MKKTLIAIILLATVVQCQSVKDGDKITEWTPIAATPNARLFYSSIARNENTVKVWFKIDFPNGSDVAGGDFKAGRDFGSVRGYGVLNCADASVKTGPALVLYYDRAGRLVKSMKEREKSSDQGFAPLFAFFCEQGLDKKPLTAPQLKPKP
jgi:hypothetical protein